MRSISSIPAAARRPDPRKKWIIAGAAAAALLLGWFIYSRIDHYLLASRSNELSQESQGLDKLIDRRQAARGQARPKSPSGPTKT